LVDPRGKKKKEKVFGKEGGTNKKNQSNHFRFFVTFEILVINL
jgi:hypothetical protein